MLLGQPMSDVAVAEGDAEKGEIVISPAAHVLLHPATFVPISSKKNSATNSPRRPHSSSGGSGMRGAALAGSNRTLNGSATVVGAATSAAEEEPHPLACGCTRTPSGYYKIQSSLEDMLCNVDFSAPVTASTTHGMPNIEEFEGNSDLQFEFEIYAAVVDELMSGYKAVSPKLLAEFADVLKRLAVIVPSPSPPAVNAADDGKTMSL